MAVTLTEAAAKHVEKFLTKRGKGVGLRLGVKTSGCSGMAYKLEFADVVNEDDQVWESFGVKVKVSRKGSRPIPRMKRAAAAAAIPSTAKQPESGTCRVPVFVFGDSDGSVQSLSAVWT